MHWQIQQTESGVVLGVFDGATGAEAVDALARDQGYADAEDADDAVEGWADGLDVRPIDTTAHGCGAPRSLPVPTHLRTRPCPDCDGRGHSDAPCPECTGTMHVPGDGCWTCGEQGHMPCARCGGHGEVLCGACDRAGAAG